MSPACCQSRNAQSMNPVCGWLVTMATMMSLVWALYCSELTTTAGRTRVADRSVKGNGTKTTSPFTYAIELPPVIVRGVFRVVPVYGETGLGKLRPVLALRRALGQGHLVQVRTPDAGGPRAQLVQD